MTPKQVSHFGAGCKCGYIKSMCECIIKNAVGYYGACPLDCGPHYPRCVYHAIRSSLERDLFIAQLAASKGSG